MVGTWCFDDYPTYDEWISWFDLDVARPDMHKLAQYHESHLPVWAAGNAYLAGAQPWKHETQKLVNGDAPITVELVEQDGAYRLRTNLFDVLGDFRCGMIHSDILGKAFEPDERYENPDGSPITFDRDYFGNTRGVAPLPGPFASADSLKEALW